MKKIELEIVALQSSVTHMHSYAVVLGEINGTRRIPIVIGGFEAQAIAVALENLHPKRPLTHDLMVAMLTSFDVTLSEILIYRLEEGIFYAQLICSREEATYQIDCRTSDALALAIRTSAPIYAYESILDAAGMEVNDPLGEEESMSPEGMESEEQAQENIGGTQLSSKSLEELEKMLEEVLEQEDYALAIQIRDEINKRKK